MIEESDYKLPRPEQPKRERTEEEQRQSEETLAYLESLPWRPHGDEW
jgi:hypothetical protein